MAINILISNIQKSLLYFLLLAEADKEVDPLNWLRDAVPALKFMYRGPIQVSNKSSAFFKFRMIKKLL